MNENTYIDEFVRLMAATKSGSKERKLLAAIMLRGCEWGPEESDLQTLLWPDYQACDHCDCGWIPGVRPWCGCDVECSKCGADAMRNNDRADDKQLCHRCDEN